MELTPLVARAEALAREAHRDQRRKGAGGLPYFEHLASVARRLASFGVVDDASLAAAYLHDLLEDQPGHEARLRAELPPEVVATVEVLSEQKVDASGAKRPKRERFAGYVAALSADTEAARRARAVSCCDKIDNVESLLADERSGAGLLTTLSTKPGEHAEQLATLRAVYAPSVPAAMLAAYDRAAAELAEYLRGWLPGRALAIAATAHLGQRDKAGAPYALHPLRLALRAESPEEMMAAALHDVVEDTPWTLADLAREGFPPEVIVALDRLTKREGESYDDFVARAGGDPIAARVKLYDLEDNLDARRMTTLESRDLERIGRYHKARQRLIARLDEERRARADGSRGGLLTIALDDPSIAAARSLAVFPEVRGDHVTLARAIGGVDPDPSWMPFGARVGDRVAIETVGIAAARGVQALLVAIGGSTVRPWDRGRLHVTVSRTSWARSKDSNALLAYAATTPVGDRGPRQLSGTVRWQPRSPG